MAWFGWTVAAAPLLLLCCCAIPVAEAPRTEEVRTTAVAKFDSPIDPSVRPQDLPPTPIPTDEEIVAFRARVRRLSPREFPNLPAPVIEILVERKCLIPQSGSSGPLGNVIEGEFFEAGRKAWAAICSRNGRSQVLAFRDPLDAEPAIVEELEDQVCFSEEWNCGMLYGTNISPVGRDFILSHYRMLGGPEPPPIDHQGINVGIWEKASVVRYFHNGEWLSLTGAD